VDVVNNPQGRERLLQLGARTVPVLARNNHYIFCQNLEDVAEFVGLQGSGHTPLPPEALFEKWITILRAAQRYIRQLPTDRLNERVIENRDRTIRLLCHHIFRIGEAFLETAIHRVEYRAENANVPPPEHTFLGADEFRDYADRVIARVENWWATLGNKSCAQKVKTFYGEQPLHQLFERSTWHSGQHTRQLIALLERFSIEPDGPLTAEDLAGLPLPERLWD
jgi:hypothetical protein